MVFEVLISRTPKPTADGEPLEAHEELPTYAALQMWMNFGDERFDGDAIRPLYDSGEYPFPQNSVSSA